LKILHEQSINKYNIEESTVKSQQEFDTFIEVCERLKVNPFENSKQMQSPLEYLCEAYIGSRACRLCFRVEINSHKLYLKYLGSRTSAINPKSY
jgi:hypothetical protein